MFPWLVFLKRSGKRLSDIEFLMVQEFNGNLTHDENTVSTATDLVKITAGAGDMYLAKAKVSVRTEAAENNGVAIIELQAGADGSETTIATCAIALSLVAGGEGSNTSDHYEFVMSGNKVTTGQVIQLVVTSVSADIEVNGELVCVEVDTNASPAV